MYLDIYKGTTFDLDRFLHLIELFEIEADTTSPDTVEIHLLKHVNQYLDDISSSI